MNNKLSELKAAALAATPGPWMKIDYFWIGRAGAINSEFITCDNGPDADYIKRVSPDVVLALLAELEAKDKRIAELECANKSQDDHINQQQDRIDSLEKTNAGLGRGLAASKTNAEYYKSAFEEQRDHADMLEKRLATLKNEFGELWKGNVDLLARLATPVRLPTEHELHQVACSECAGNCLELVESTVRAAGFTFTVEGDE